jgi:carboxymethylenebutenolidase
VDGSLDDYSNSQVGGSYGAGCQFKHIRTAPTLNGRAVFFGLLTIALVIVAPIGHGLAQGANPELITFTSGDLTLKGFVWKPEGPGPFPAIVWNHGSEGLPGTVDSVAPYFVSRGYVFFVPHRRGQGRSPGAYIVDQLNAAISPEQRSRMLVSLNEVHLQDQLAALAYLRSLPYVDQNRLVVMGASFGGIQTMLAVERGSGYRVAVNCSGAAQTWRGSPDLRARLTAAASKATIPVFFLQAENDYDLMVQTRRLLPGRPASRLLRFARNDSVSACHCEEYSDEAVKVRTGGNHLSGLHH